MKTNNPFFKIERAENDRFDIEREHTTYQNCTLNDAVHMFNCFMRRADDDEYDWFKSAYHALHDMGVLTEKDCEKIITRWQKKHMR